MPLVAPSPYRLGVADEAIASLYERIVKEVSRQIDDGDDLTISKTKTMSANFAASRQGLEIATKGGTHNCSLKLPMQKWDSHLRQAAGSSAGPEKVVLFAQPIETVIALSRYLERKDKRRPALIIGGQSDQERQARQIDQLSQARRTAVSRLFLALAVRASTSKSHRRLVHIDVPW